MTTKVVNLVDTLTDDIEDLDLDHLLHSSHNSTHNSSHTSHSSHKSKSSESLDTRRGRDLDTSNHNKRNAENSENSGNIENLENAEHEEEETLDDGLALLPNYTSKRSQKLRKDIEGYENIPGTQTIYIKTYGCSHNQSDSEYMAGLLTESGYAITDNFENADAYLLNSCTVKNPSQDTMTNLMDKARVTGKPVIVSGCVPQGEKKSKLWEDVSVIGVQQIQHAKYVVEEALKGNKVHLFSRKKDNKPSLALPKVRHNPFIEIVPINVGCLNQCTYCKTKHARGDLASWSIQEIEERIQKVIGEGVKEIRLTSEDTGAYGIDIGTDIAQLLNKIVESVPDGVMLRVGMTNPPYIKRHIAEVAKILNHPNVFSFLHIPIQSGNDKVLYDMKREYTVEDFRYIVRYLREHVPHISIATDIICGFPTETDEDFEDTLLLCDEFKFEAVNISQFYPRPGTPAARMKRVPTQAVKERSRKITKLFNSYSTYEYLRGQTVRAWITEVARDGHHLAGHTKCYVQCLIDPSEAEVGSNVWVEIQEIDKFFVKGRVVPGPSHAQNETQSKAQVQRKEEASSSRTHLSDKTTTDRDTAQADSSSIDTDIQGSLQEHARKEGNLIKRPSAFSARGASAMIGHESTDIKPSKTPVNVSSHASTPSQTRGGKKNPETEIVWKQLFPIFIIFTLIFLLFLFS